MFCTSDRGILAPRQPQLWKPGSFTSCYDLSYPLTHISSPASVILLHTIECNICRCIPSYTEGSGCYPYELRISALKQDFGCNSVERLALTWAPVFCRSLLLFVDSPLCSISNAARAM